MIPIILISVDQKDTLKYLETYVKKYGISSHNVVQIYPEKQEFSLAQIRQVKKEVIFQQSQNCVYVLHDFHKASFEAQNAFLKTMEEHGKTIHFLLVVQNTHRLLPTIRSRSRLVTQSRGKLTPDKEITQELENLLASGKSTLFKKLYLKSKKELNPFNLIDQMLYFFRERLSFDTKASLMMRELLNARYALEYNHVDPQLTLDHLIITIKKSYIKI